MEIFIFNKKRNFVKEDGVFSFVFVIVFVIVFSVQQVKIVIELFFYSGSCLKLGWEVLNFSVIFFLWLVMLVIYVVRVRFFIIYGVVMFFFTDFWEVEIRWYYKRDL